MKMNRFKRNHGWLLRKVAVPNVGRTNVGFIIPRTTVLYSNGWRDSLAQKHSLCHL